MSPNGRNAVKRLNQKQILIKKKKMKKLSKSEYAKAKACAEASSTEVLLFFMQDTCATEKKQLRNIAQIELDKRKNIEYCKYYNI